MSHTEAITCLPQLSPYAAVKKEWEIKGVQRYASTVVLQLRIIMVGIIMIDLLLVLNWDCLLYWLIHLFILGKGQDRYSLLGMVAKLQTFEELEVKRSIKYTVLR